MLVDILHFENLKSLIVPVVESLPCQNDYVLPNWPFILSLLILKQVDESRLLRYMCRFLKIYKKFYPCISIFVPSRQIPRIRSSFYNLSKGYLGLGCDAPYNGMNPLLISVLQFFKISPQLKKKEFFKSTNSHFQINTSSSSSSSALSAAKPSVSIHSGQISSPEQCIKS